ncbi:MULTISPECIES: SAM-dependent methyltransferase [Acidiphilium]|uniref:Cyclopropane-fatty-acyl-phospholipid synthase n=1 Tax=Acidiphilium cryptum (strain JF-5) TaxID=349163 RepID=A5FYN5_ACICJ|nr:MULTISPECIES: cyclopropane-fatty-acyl-phospholipid synthase family protein [Acidiphilium]ABQ30717.1 cyclopropane-fatty-acyl-phospholipid synthase [Acidiphilium cryptum JF-5]UNC15238.1 class I SAM-dependent methyltransferase [Acidiphilium multivorum]
MRILLDNLLKRLVAHGDLSVIWPDGAISHYAGRPGRAATLAIRDPAIIRRLVTDPAMALGEGYMEGALDPVDGSIYDVLHVLLSSVQESEGRIPALRLRNAFGRVFRPLAQLNNARRSKRNVAHHYDLNGRLYALFLDRDRQYSCGYFPRGDETIDEAQAAKKRHIASKLLLDRPDLEVLDIGCGWGGMALTMARDYGARVTGITLSEEQLAEARRRAEAEGLADRVSFELMDYRAMTREFDRIVSVGMFEHVGVPNYPSFFATVQRCLKPDGVALLHAIGRFDGPDVTSPWLAKYIFPGGYSPSLSEVFAPLERSGLRSTDIEILRLHYAKTLAHWRKRFAANRDAIASLYDERFCRMFEFYLAGSQLAFEVQDHMVFQIQLARRQDAAPLTRDYMIDAERAAQSLSRSISAPHAASLRSTAS